MRTINVNASWIKHAPHMRMDFKFWSEVARHIEQNGKGDGEESVKEAIRTAIEERDATVARARALRDQAAELVSRAREEEESTFDLNPRMR